MKVTGILFDKDGTLIDFDKTWGAAAVPVIKRIFQTYRILDCPKHREAVLTKLGISCGKVDPDGAFAWKSFSMIAEELLPLLQTMTDSPKPGKEELTENLETFFEEEILCEGKEMATTADLSAVMNFLKERDIKIGIATTDTYKATVETLRRLDILSYFSFFSMDRMPVPMPIKPSGEIIRQAAWYWNTDCDHILVVGDTPNDMRFAHNGGAVAVGVLSGTGNESALRPLADHVLESVGDLPRLIYELEQEGQE